MWCREQWLCCYEKIEDSKEKWCKCTEFVVDVFFTYCAYVNAYHAVSHNLIHFIYLRECFRVSSFISRHIYSSLFLRCMRLCTCEFLSFWLFSHFFFYIFRSFFFLSLIHHVFTAIAKVLRFFCDVLHWLPTISLPRNNENRETKRAKPWEIKNENAACVFVIVYENVLWIIIRAFDWNVSMSRKIIHFTVFILGWFKI